MQKGNWIILVLGVIAVAAGIFVYYNASSFQEKSTLTTGKVVHVLGSSYRIAYATADGTEKLKQGSGKNHGFREGDSVNVWYRNDNPDKARITDGKKGAKKIFIAAGFCILLGIYPMFMRKKEIPSAPAS